MGVVKAILVKNIHVKCTKRITNSVTNGRKCCVKKNKARDGASEGLGGYSLLWCL